MPKKNKEVPALHGDIWSFWVSTFAWLTAADILKHYGIILGREALIKTLKTPNSFYNALLQIPRELVANGLILQKVQRYQGQLQQMFVDYLVSGEGEKDETFPGQGLREDIERSRLGLVHLNEEVDTLQDTYLQLIKEAQRVRQPSVLQWKKRIEKAIASFIHVDPEKGKIFWHERMEHFLSRYDFLQDPNAAIAELADLVGGAQAAELLISHLRDLQHYKKDLEQDFTARMANEIEANQKGLSDLQTQLYDLLIESKHKITLLPPYVTNPEAPQRED